MGKGESNLWLVYRRFVFLWTGIWNKMISVYTVCITDLGLHEGYTAILDFRTTSVQAIWICRIQVIAVVPYQILQIEALGVIQPGRCSYYPGNYCGDLWHFLCVDFFFCKWMPMWSQKCHYWIKLGGGTYSINLEEFCGLFMPTWILRLSLCLLSHQA